MFKKLKKSIALLLTVVMSLGISVSALAAEPANSTDTVTINLFDPDDPSLIKIEDADDTARTTSRPTTIKNLATEGRYNYSAYSNNNIMWTKYVFFDPGNLGNFIFTANSTNTNYRLVVHNSENGKDYYYAINSTNVVCKTSSYSDWNNADTFYFGIDTTVNKTAVSVNGYVDLC